MNFERFRPWIVVIEVGCKTEIEWEGLIIDFGYRYTLYDGINRYYVAEEKFSDLGKTCSRPAGSLDVYEKAEHRRLRLWYEELLGRYAELRDR